LLDQEEYNRWMKSAEKTLKSAYIDLDTEFYNWACFKAHQAAEKALKALLWGCGKPGIRHTLPKLLENIKELGVKVPEKIKENCIRLSKYYTITRYPDVWENGIPEDYFTVNEAREAIKMAEEVIKWVKDTWGKLISEAKQIT